MTPPEQTIALDRPRRIAYTQRARYRMGSLDAPFDLRDLGKPKKLYAALTAWIWACLVPADAADFAAPEDVAPHMPMDAAALTPLLAALAEAVKAATDEKKTAMPSATGPSPGSNSA